MVTLYYSPGSCSLAPRIILVDAGLAHDLKLVSIARGEHNAPEFLAINPRGRIPVLVEDGEVLVETLAILMRLAALAPEARLLPSAPVAQSRCLSVMAWLSSTLQPGFSRVFRPARISTDEAAHPGVKDAGKAFCWQNVREIDRLLARQEWLTGDSYGVADSYALIFYAWGKRIGLPMQELSHYTEFKDRMLARASVARILREESSILVDTA
ncbi:MAG TPA: glutathione S-transferase N-terminal domain-containing protein [Roseiarcus sp.]|jgi:glutathione S-transferase